MSKPRKDSKPGSDSALRQAADKRHAQAEAACRTVLDTFAALAEDSAWQGCEMAVKYAQMAAVYARKIRNGRVISPADFNAAVEVCTAARRALRSLDAELAFAGHPQQTALTDAANLSYQVLLAHHQLTKGKA